MYYDFPEITPHNKKGDFRYNKANEKVVKFASNEVEARALIEGQFMAKRLHVEKMGFKIGNLYTAAFVVFFSSNHVVCRRDHIVCCKEVWVEKVSKRSPALNEHWTENWCSRAAQRPCRIRLSLAIAMNKNERDFFRLPLETKQILLNGPFHLFPMEPQPLRHTHAIQSPILFGISPCYFVWNF